MLQQRITHHTAPTLAAWLTAGHQHSDVHRITVAPMKYDGNKAQAEMLDMEPLPAGWAQHRVVRVPVREPVQLAPYSIHDVPHAVTMRTKTFEVIDLALNMTIGDPYGSGMRTLSTRLTVYAVQGVSEMIIRTADKRSASELARVYSQHVAAAGEAIMRVVGGMTEIKVVARQSCFR